MLPAAEDTTQLRQTPHSLLLTDAAAYRSMSRFRQKATAPVFPASCQRPVGGVFFYAVLSAAAGYELDRRDRV
jgi:hypothetical protein